jgi:hypothetical protein
MKRLYESNGLRVSRIEGFGRLGRIHNIAPTLLSGSIRLVGIKE